MSRILVVEDTPEQAILIAGLLEDDGLDVELVPDGRAAIAALAEHLPDVVVTDLHMPEVNGLELVEHVAREHPGVPVVLMTAFGTEEIAVEALKKGAATYIPKKHLVDDLVESVNQLLDVKESERDRAQVLQMLTSSDLRFEMSNDTGLIAPLIGYLEHVASARLGLKDDPRLIQVGTAVSEAILNAVHHGNLEVDSALREEDPQAYLDLVKKRARETPYEDRRVRIHVEMTPSRLRVTVEDDGRGFDPEEVSNPIDPENLLRVSGRGLYLISSFMDQVSHNDKGNVITMVKRFDDASAPAS